MQALFNGIIFRENQKEIETGSVNQDEIRWFFDAVKKSLISNHPTHKVCAILLHRNKLVEWSLNTNKSHPFQARYSDLKKSLHAEIGLINKIRKNNIQIDHHHKLIVARLTRKWVAPSFPCSVCERVIKQAGISNVIGLDHRYAIEKRHLAIGQLLSQRNKGCLL